MTGARPADDIGWAGAVTWRQCRDFAEILSHTERAGLVRASLRPRGLSGLWRARAPVAVQLWVAGAQGRLVRPHPTSPSFAVIEAPVHRRRAFASDRRTRWLAAIDRAWDHVVFGGVPALLMGCAVIVLALRSQHPTHRLVALILVTCAMAWVAVGMVAWLGREVIRSVRDSRADPVAAASGGVVHASWSVALCHVDPTADAENETNALLRLSLDRIAALWRSLPTRADDVRPSRRVVMLDGITSGRAERLIVAHPDAMTHLIHGRPPIVLIGTGDLDARPPRQLVGAQGIGLLLFAVVLVVVVLALIVSDQEAAAGRGTSIGGLTSYGQALIWLVERLLWMGQEADPVPVLARTRVMGWALHLLGPVVSLAVLAAVVSTVRKNKAVQQAIEDDATDHEQGLRPTLAIITALPEEFAAVHAMIDEPRRGRPAGDGRLYIVGRMPSADPVQPHRLVLVQQDFAGGGLAASVTTHLTRSYPSVNHVIMCGIACGVPRPEQPARHVRLGDVVVATWGVVAFDHVDEHPAGPRLRDPQLTPASVLVVAANAVQAEQWRGHRPWQQVVEARASRLQPQFARPPEHTDVVHTEDGAVVGHPPGESSGHLAGMSTAHQGRIGASDRSLRNADKRQEIAEQYDLMAIEMEGHGIATAALANDVGWLVVRGISDYGDSHTRAVWRHHAALVAAAYVRCLFGRLSPMRPHGGQPLGDPE